MSKKAFDKIATGLDEALAIARGQAKPAKLHIPVQIDVKAIRTKLGLSQDDFAAQFGFTVNQIKDWEVPASGWCQSLPDDHRSRSRERSHALALRC
jgi:DNA-binding transcriptional regulator YiaG